MAWALCTPAICLTLVVLSESCHPASAQTPSSQDSSCCLNVLEDECSKNFTVGYCDDESTLTNCFALNENNHCVESKYCFTLKVNSYCVDSNCYFNQSCEDNCNFGRKRRDIALWLSVFLMNFGAANFYIERYGLAIAQIILGLFLCLFQFGSCAVAGTRDGETTPPCLICCSVNTFLSLLFLSWWVADLVTFATNLRRDGSFCPLI